MDGASPSRLLARANIHVLKPWTDVRLQGSHAADDAAMGFSVVHGRVHSDAHGTKVGVKGWRNAVLRMQPGVRA